MADEVTIMMNLMNFLVFFFRYVDDQKDRREVFLQFLELERITGSHTGLALLSFHKSSGIDIKQCRGQWGSQHAMRKIRNSFLDFERI